MAGISATGYWLDETDEHHAFDEALAAELASFFQSKSVVDLGCGPGNYVSWLRRSGIECDGYDGNPNTELLSNGLCKVLDLSARVELGRTYDWVLSLEVGEHIPQEYEAVFLDNLARHAREGIVLSWGVPGQGGWGHVNLHPNRYIKDCLRARGFVEEALLESFLRHKCAFQWFKGTLMIFRRESGEKSTPPASRNGDASIPANSSTFGINDARLEDLANTLKEIQRGVDNTYWLTLMQRIRDTVETVVPPGAVILIVGNADDELMMLPGRHPRPFPQTPAGAYSRWYPLRGSDALAHLKRLQNEGADFILFPATSFWWLDHFSDLREYLESDCSPVFQAESCKIFELQK